MSNQVDDWVREQVMCDYLRKELTLQRIFRAMEGHDDVTGIAIDVLVKEGFAENRGDWGELTEVGQALRECWQKNFSWKYP